MKTAFVLEDGVIFYRTYSTYARGLDGLWGMYQWLDRPQGRDENGVWWRRHRRIRVVSSERRLVLPRCGTHA